MTASEMVLEFRLSSDNLDSNTIPNLEDAQILYYLNESQERFVKNRYMPIKQLAGRQFGFEEIQKRIDDLKNLVVTNFAPVQLLSTEDNTYRTFLTFFTDEARTTVATNTYMFHIRTRVKVNKTGCSPKYVDVTFHQHDDLAYVMGDPFNKPSFIEPVGYFENGNINIIAGENSTISGAKITYLKKPRIISNMVEYAPLADCELSEHTHKEIVQEAVLLALGDLEAQKFNIKQATNSNLE